MSLLKFHPIKDKAKQSTITKHYCETIQIVTLTFGLYHNLESWSQQETLPQRPMVELDIKQNRTYVKLTTTVTEAPSYFQAYVK